MTDLLQVTRAGPTQASGRMALPASRKDLQSASSFFEALENERSKDRERVDEPRSTTREEKEDDRSHEVKSSALDPNDPSRLVNPLYPAAPVKADEPPDKEEPGHAEKSQESSPVSQASGSTAPEDSSTPAAPSAQAKKTAGQASEAAAETDNASPAAEQDAAQVQAAGDQPGTQPTAAAAQGVEVNLTATQAVPAQAQAADPATAAQRLANEMKIEGAAQSAQGAKAAQESHAAKGNPGEAKANNEQQPGSEQAKAPTQPAMPPQMSVEGTKAPTNPVFEPARLAEAQTKGPVWQVCQSIESMVKNHQPALRLVLYPEELGRIDLRLTTSSAGLGVTVTAEQATTNQLLESQMAQLRQALNDAGIQLSHFNIGQQRSQSNPGNPNQSSHGSHSGRSFRAAAVEKNEARASGRTLTSESVDYKI